MTRLHFQSKKVFCVTMCFVFFFGFASYVTALTATENLNIELVQLATRADILQSDIAKAKADPQTDTVTLDKLEAEAVVIKNRVTEIVGFFTDAPTAGEVKASPTPAACGGNINLVYKAPTSGTVVTYELSRKPYDASLPQANWAWGVVASGVSLDALPKSQTNLSVGTSYQYQLRAIGVGGVDSFSEIAQIKSSIACPPPVAPVATFSVSPAQAFVGEAVSVTATWSGGNVTNPTPDCGVGAIFSQDLVYDFPNNNVRFRCLYSSSGTKTIKLTGVQGTTPTGSGTVSIAESPSAGNASTIPTDATIFDKPGTFSWTAPSGVTKIQVWAWGGGGAGGSADPDYLDPGAGGGGGAGGSADPDYLDPGAGGGGGGFGGGEVSVVPGNNYSIVVGNGGQIQREAYGRNSGVGGGAVPSATYRGERGGDSKFGDLVTARGGEGGANFGSDTVLDIGHGAGASAPIIFKGLDSQGTSGGRGAGGGGAGGPLNKDGSAPGGGGGANSDWEDGTFTMKGGDGKVVIKAVESVPVNNDLPVTAVTGDCGDKGEINLKWTKADATKWAGYRVYRFDKDPFIDPSSYQEVTVIRDINQTSYIDTTPKQDTQYWYSIKTLTRAELGMEVGLRQTAGVLLAQSGGVVNFGSGLASSADSAVSSGPCPKGNLPNVLMPFAETGSCGGKIKITWTPWTGDPRVVGYVIYRFEQDAVPWRQSDLAILKVIKVRGATSGGYIDTAPSVNTRYLYYVIASAAREMSGSNLGNNLENVQGVNIVEANPTDVLAGTNVNTTRALFLRVGFPGGPVYGEHGAIITPYSTFGLSSDSCSPIQNPDLAPAVNTPVISDGEASARWTDTSVTPNVTYLTPGKKVKIDGGVLNLGSGIVPSAKHFNVRFQKSESQTFAPTNAGVVDAVSPAGGLLKDGKIPVSYTHTSVASDEGKTYYFRYCVDQPPTDDVGNVIERQGANDSSVVPAVGEYNNCSGATAVKFRTPEKPTCDCDAINSSLSMPQGAMVIAANTPSVAGTKDIRTDDASVIKLRWSSTGAESVTLFKVLSNGKTEGSNLIVGNLASGEISLTNLTVGEYDYVFTATNLGGECVSKVHFNIVAAPSPNPDLVPNDTPEITGPAGSTWTDTSVTPNVTYFIPGTTLTLKAQPKNKGIGNVPLGSTFNVKFQAKLHSATESSYDDLTNVASVSPPFSVLTSGAVVQKSPTDQRPTITHNTSALVTTEQVWDFRYCVDMPPNDYVGKVVEKQSVYTNVNSNPDKTAGVGEYNNCSGATTIKLKLELPIVPTPTVTLQIRKSGTNEYKNPSVDVNYAEQIDLKWTATNATSCTASGDWIGSKNKEGGEEISVGGPLSRASYTYTVECEGLGGKTQPVSVTAKTSLSVACSSTVSEKTITWRAVPTPATLPSGPQLSYSYAWSSVDATPVSALTKDYVATYLTAGEKVSSLVLTAKDGRVNPNIVRTVPITCRATAIEPPPAKNPDLIISVKPAVTRSTGAVGPLYVGERLTFTTTVKNQGESPASNIFYNRFQILREDKTVEANIGEPTLPSLAVGDTEVVTSSSWTAVVGTYRVVACADTSNTSTLHNKINEGDKEGNNCSPSDSGAGGTTIKVEKPDLTPLGAAGTNDSGLPNAPVPSGTTFAQSGVTYYKVGTIVTFTVEPKNIGGTFAAPSFKVKLQAKDAAHPDTLAGDAFYIDRGRAEISGGLLYNQSKTATIEETSGATETKAFKYRYCADLPPNENQTGDPTGFGAVAESKEGNNCSGSVVVRYGLPNVPPPTLNLKVRKAGVDPYTHELLTVDDGDSVDIIWNYTGQSACTASWKNPSAISGVDSDLSVGPLRRTGSPYTYTVTCGSLTDTVRVNVNPLKPPQPLSCVLNVRPYTATGTSGPSSTIFEGEAIQLQWGVTGASSISLYKFSLNSRAGDNLVPNNNPIDDVVVSDLLVGQYQYKLNVTDAEGVTQGCVVAVHVGTAPKPDLAPSSPLDVYGPNNPDKSFISGEIITLSAVPKNIGGSRAVPFNVRFQYKLGSDPDINHYTPFLKAGMENFARVPNGLGARLTLPTVVSITHASDKNETATYDFRYCVDLPQTLSPRNSGIVGNVNEIQISDADDRINRVGEYNNCSVAKSVRFAPPPPSPSVPSGRVSCGALTSSTIELPYTYSTAMKPSLFKDGETVPIQTFADGGGSGLYTNTGLTPGSTHTYRLRNGNDSTSELLDSATCTTRSGSALSVECKVLPDHLDLANTNNGQAVWKADTKGTGVYPYKFKWSGDGLLGLHSPIVSQDNSVYEVTVSYPQNTDRNPKTGTIEVTDSRRERVNEPQSVAATCGLPGTESPPVSHGSLTVSCKVSVPETDVAIGKQFVTWDAKIINTGVPGYTYVWKVGILEDASSRNKTTTKVWADAGSNPAAFPIGAVTVADSFYWMRNIFETKTASCGVDVSNSNDAFTLSVSPRAIMNFLGQKAVSSKVVVKINADQWFKSPVTITPSGTVGGVPVTYAFYKRGAGAVPSGKIPNTVTITSTEYFAADFGLDMVIESGEFISPNRYEKAVTVRGDGGVKQDTKFVSVDVNDSRPVFQNF